jgi:hypothetical protein
MLLLDHSSPKSPGRNRISASRCCLGHRVTYSIAFILLGPARWRPARTSNFFPRPPRSLVPSPVCRPSGGSESPSSPLPVPCRPAGGARHLSYLPNVGLLTCPCCTPFADMRIFPHPLQPDIATHVPQRLYGCRPFPLVYASGRRLGCFKLPSDQPSTILAVVMPRRGVVHGCCGGLGYEWPRHIPRWRCLRGDRRCNKKP